MTLKALKEQFITLLSPLYGEEETAQFFYRLLAHFHQMKRVDFVFQSDFEPDSIMLQKWVSALEELQNQRPIQYIIGETDFYGLSFFVDANVLIPRPETEELVEWVIQSLQPKVTATDGIRILDIGTGSGCIPISLQSNLPQAEVFAIDVSAAALAVAQRNAAHNAVTVQFIQADILTTTSLLEFTPVLDVIVSNPPYVLVKEKEEMSANVLDYEPHLALFVSDTDPLLFYRKIALLATKALKPGGCLFFEINRAYGQETIRLLQDVGFQNVELRMDLFGNDRMVKAVWQ